MDEGRRCLEREIRGGMECAPVTRCRRDQKAKTIVAVLQKHEHVRQAHRRDDGDLDGQVGCQVVRDDVVGSQ